MQFSNVKRSAFFLEFWANWNKMRWVLTFSNYAVDRIGLCFNRLKNYLSRFSISIKYTSKNIGVHDQCSHCYHEQYQVILRGKISNDQPHWFCSTSLVLPTSFIRIRISTVISLFLKKSILDHSIVPIQFL